MTNTPDRVEAIALLPCPLCDANLEPLIGDDGMEHPDNECVFAGIYLNAQLFDMWNQRTATRQLEDFRAANANLAEQIVSLANRVAEQGRLLSECSSMIGVMRGCLEQPVGAFLREVNDLLTRIGNEHD